MKAILTASLQKVRFPLRSFFGNEEEIFFVWFWLYFEGFCNFHFLSVIFRLLILDIPIFHERMANAVFMLPCLLLFLLMLFVGIVTVLNYYCYLFATIICFFPCLLLFGVAFFLSHSSPFLFKTKCEWIIVCICSVRVYNMHCLNKLNWYLRTNEPNAYFAICAAVCLYLCDSWLKKITENYVET